MIKGSSFLPVHEYAFRLSSKMPRSCSSKKALRCVKQFDWHKHVYYDCDDCDYDYDYNDYDYDYTDYDDYDDWAGIRIKSYKPIVKVRPLRFL
jgi:hypothetical protein